tara:strand:+ start:35 stop:352 length:318 start_codon:yes stop_codon:yes gene_type:complete
MAEIKFTIEDIKSLNDLSQKYQTIQASFGQIRVQKILLSQQNANLEEAEAKLEADYIDNQNEERGLVKKLNEKYGPGTLDPETGVFTPTEEVKQETSEEIAEEAK